MNMPVFILRALEPSDAQGMAALFSQRSTQEQTLQLPYPGVAAWQKRLASGTVKHGIVAVMPDGQLIGQCSVFPHASPRQKHVGEIGIAVSENWQGCGVGRALLTAIIEVAENWLAMTRLELSVYSDNAAAIALYQRLGFEREGIQRAYALRGGRYSDVYRMARLKPAN